MYSKGNHKEDEKTTLRMGVIFVNEVIGKGLISKIYKQLIQLDIRKMSYPIRKCTEDLQTFLQRRHTDGE